jgi:hypothetical protein
MRTHRLLAGITAALLLGAACSDDSGSDDLAAFCEAGAEIESRTATIDSPEAAVTVFTDLRPTISDMVDAAPDDLAEAASSFADHVDTLLETGDPTPFEDGSVDELVSRFDDACAAG